MYRGRRAMGEWSISEPRRLDFDEPVNRLDVRLVSGRLNVVGSDGPSRLEVAAVGSKPLIATLQNGALRLGYEDFPATWAKWSGPLWWFRYGRQRYRCEVSIAVPPQTLARLRLVSGSLIASGLRDGVSVEVTSGRVTLLGLGGRITAKM